MNTPSQNILSSIWHSAKKDWKENPIRVSAAIIGLLGVSSWGVWRHQYVSRLIKSTAEVNISLLVLALVSFAYALLLLWKKYKKAQRLSKEQTNISDENIKSLNEALSIATTDNDKIMAANIELRQKHIDYIDTIENLKKEKDNLQSQLNEINNPSLDRLILDEPELKILVFLSQQEYPIQDYYVKEFLRLPPQIAIFHIEELLTKTPLLERSHNYEGVPQLSLSQEGRRFLKKRNAL